MYTLDPTGIYIAGDLAANKLVPYGDIKGDIRKINLAEEIITGWNLLKPGLSEEYMGVEGDPLHVIMIETEEGRYVLRGDDMDDFVAKANAKLHEWRAANVR